jgi:hypothetical protein
MMNKKAILSICSVNYLNKALVLFDGCRLNNPDCDLFLVLVDRKQQINITEMGLNVIWAEDLPIKNFLQHAFEYDVIEFNTNVKPTALKVLLQKYESVIYLDPDIKVYSSLSGVFSVLTQASVVVTPHYNKPILDGNKPDDLELLKFGAFNLGFVGVSACEEGFQFLDWWSDRCLGHGFYEPQMGLGVDQKWVGLAPCFFPHMKILHDEGLNVAFWNLHERYLSKGDAGWMVNDNTPLKFIHFSSFNQRAPEDIAQKQTRFTPFSRPDFDVLAIEYARELESKTDAVISNSVYGFDYFDDGAYITPTLRRFYSCLRENNFSDVANPFAGIGPVKSFAKKNHLLVKGKPKSHRHIFKDLSAYSFQIKLITKLLHLVFIILGPERYFNLMRYLAHISSLRNQGDMFNLPSPRYDSAKNDKL